jgi:hypothetical protein
LVVLAVVYFVSKWAYSKRMAAQEPEGRYWAPAIFQTDESDGEESV